MRLYMSGHEHNLQHLHVDGASTHYMISGGGSLSDYSWQTWDNGGGKFFYQGSGEISQHSLWLRDLLVAVVVAVWCDCGVVWLRCGCGVV